MVSRLLSRIKQYLPWFRKKDPFLHPGEIEAQTRYGTREAMRNKIEKIILRKLEPDYADFIRPKEFFFIATADTRGRCDCAFRGIDPEAKRLGYPALRIENETTLLFPDYPGNGMFQSLGNLLTNPHIGMLFVDFQTSQRVRVNGGIKLIEDEAEARRLFGPPARRMVRVTIEEVFANCPRRVPVLADSVPSPDRD